LQNYHRGEELWGPVPLHPQGKSFSGVKTNTLK